MSEPNDDGFLDPIRRTLMRMRRAQIEGEPTLARQLAQIGVLGWIVVAPALAGLLLGRWLDRMFASGIFWAAGLLFAGIMLGFWSAWRWMHSS